MAYVEPRSFSPDPLGADALDLLRTAQAEGRVSADLTEQDPQGGDGMARYAILEALCAKGLLDYDGDEGFGDELELGFVLTEAGKAALAEV